MPLSDVAQPRKKSGVARSVHRIFRGGGDIGKIGGGGEGLPSRKIISFNPFVNCSMVIFLNILDFDNFDLMHIF